MSGPIIFVVVALWAGLGFVLWKILVRPRVRSVTALYAATASLALLWFVGPVADEILGAREFKRLCDEMPGVKFYGPIAVGPSPFYDERGQRKLWAQREIEAGGSPFPKSDIKLAYAEGRRFQEAWQVVFKSTPETRRIQVWPIPVLEERLTYTHKSSGTVMLVSYWRASPGGWIKRLTGWGSHAPYQCPNRGNWPQEWNWIKY